MTVLSVEPRLPYPGLGCSPVLSAVCSALLTWNQSLTRAPCIAIMQIYHSSQHQCACAAVCVCWNLSRFNIKNLPANTYFTNTYCLPKTTWLWGVKLKRRTIKHNINHTNEKHICQLSLINSRQFHGIYEFWEHCIIVIFNTALLWAFCVGRWTSSIVQVNKD